MLLIFIMLIPSTFTFEPVLSWPKDNKTLKISANFYFCKMRRKMIFEISSFVIFPRSMHKCNHWPSLFKINTLGQLKKAPKVPNLLVR